MQEEGSFGQNLVVERQKWVALSRKGQLNISPGRYIIYSFHQRKEKCKIYSTIDDRFINSCFPGSFRPPRLLRKKTLKLKPFVSITSFFLSP